MASSSEASCISDPNFAVICAFLERFATSCGITYPPFLDLQEMLENVDHVPQELIDLHIKLLRKARKSVALEKWEKALIKFCHTYSSQDGWEIERFGYKKSRLEVKLRALKALLEGQFDLNVKFKAEVNTIASEELRSKPLGKDNNGRIYWLQFDPSSNIRVYREDLDEESWTLVAKDRASLLQLLQELSGNDNPIDLNALNDDSTSLADKPILDTGQSSNSSVKNEEIPLDESSFKNGDVSGPLATDEEKDPLDTEEGEKQDEEDPKNAEKKVKNEQKDNTEEDLPETKAASAETSENVGKVDEEPSGKHRNEEGPEPEPAAKKIKLDEEVSEAIEEPVMIINGEGNGEECQTGNIVVGEAIEDPVLFFYGEGNGEECLTGNPDKDNERTKESEKSENTCNSEQIIVQQPPVETLEIKKPETETKPAPKLWSIDTICGTSVNTNLETSVDVNNIDNQDTDFKIKQKSFSSFSIDSVLEKRTVCESPKIMINCPSDSISINNQEIENKVNTDVLIVETVERLDNEKKITIESPKCNNEQASELKNYDVSKEEIKPSEQLVKADENVEVKELHAEPQSEETKTEFRFQEVEPVFEEKKLESEETKAEPELEEVKAGPSLGDTKSKPQPNQQAVKTKAEETKAQPELHQQVVETKPEEAKAQPELHQQVVEAKADPELDQRIIETKQEEGKEKPVLDEHIESNLGKLEAEPGCEESKEELVLEKEKIEPNAEKPEIEPELEEEKKDSKPEEPEVKEEFKKEEAKAELKPEEENVEARVEEKESEVRLEEEKTETKHEKIESEFNLESEEKKTVPESEIVRAKEIAEPKLLKEKEESKSELEEAKPTPAVEKVIEEPKSESKPEGVKETKLDQESKPEVKKTEPKQESKPEDVKETEPEQESKPEEVKEIKPEQKSKPEEVIEIEPEQQQRKPEVKETEPEQPCKPEVKETKPDQKCKPEIKETEPEPEPDSKPERKENPELKSKPEEIKAKKLEPETKSSPEEIEETKLKNESMSERKEEPEPISEPEEIKVTKPEPKIKPKGIELESENIEKEATEPELESTSNIGIKETNESSVSAKKQDNDLSEVVNQSEITDVEISESDKLENEGKTTEEAGGPPVEVSISEKSKEPEEENIGPEEISQEPKTDEKVKDASANDENNVKTETDDKTEEESPPKKISLRNSRGSGEEPKPATPRRKKRKNSKKKSGRKGGDTREPKKKEDDKEDEEEVENEIPVDALAGTNAEEVDPLALNNEDNEAQPENEEDQNKTPRKSRKRRSTTTNSISEDGGSKLEEEEEEGGGGKKRKMRGRKSLDAKIRKRVEEKRERRESSGEEENKEKDEKKDDDGDEKTPKKKGRPKKDEEGKSGRQIASREMKLLGITSDMDLELPSIRQSRRIAQLKLREEAERRRLEEERLEAFKSKDKKKKKDKKNKDKKRKKKYDSDGNYDEGEDSDDEEEKQKKKEEKKRKKKEKLKFNELNPWKSSSGSSSSSEEEDEDDDEEHEEEELFKSDHEFSMESDVEDPEYKPIKRARTAKVEKDDGNKESSKYDDTSCEKCSKNDHPEWILLCDKCDKGWHASCVHPVLMVVPEGDWFCPPCEHASLITKLQDSLIQYDRSQKQRENEELRKKRLAFVGISLDNVLPSKKEKKKKKKHRGSGGEEEDEEDDDDDDGDENENDASASASVSGSGSSESNSSSSGETTSDESDEPVYQLRERRTNVTSYRYNEYDELIKSALQDEIEAVKGAGNAGKGKDISNIVNAEEPEPVSANREEGEESMNGVAEATPVLGQIPAKESQEKVELKVEEKAEKNDGESDAEDGDNENGEVQNEEEPSEELLDEIPPVVPKYDKKKKKSKSLKVTSLEFTSDEENDDTSDSDFKGSSSDEESDYSLPSESESSDGVRKKRKNYDGPVRRSTRARIARYDRDFINDDSDDEAPRRKKSRNLWASESESSDSDRSWGRKKKRGGRSGRRATTSSRSRTKSKTKSSRSKPKKKRSKKRIVDSDNDDFERTIKKPKNRKIKYGGLDDPEEAEVPTRRTRGKKINYQEMNPSDDSEDGIKPRVRPMKIDSDDEYVAEKDKEVETKERGESEEEPSEDDDDDNSAGEDGFPKKKNKENGEKDKKKSKNVIPDPDDFSENDLMEDEELDEFAEELEDLDEEEEEILGEMLKEGDVPVHELKSAVKMAKEKRKMKKLAEVNANKRDALEPPPPYPPIPAHLENPGSAPKFQKIGRMKITPSRSELAMAAQFSAPVIPPQLNEQVFRGPEGVDPVGGLLLKTLQGDPQKPLDPGIPLNNPNIPLKEDALKMPLVQQPYPPQFVGDPLVRNLNQLPPVMIPNQPPAGMLPMQVGNGPHGPLPLPQYNTFQDMISPLQRMPIYPPSQNLPTTVAGISNLNTLVPDPRKKSGPKSGVKNKRKSDGMISPGPDTSQESTESGDMRLPTTQMDDFMKGSGETPPKRKGRGRGKKQLLAEAQAQAQAQATAQGKPDVTIATVQAPTQFPPQGITPEGGSVITRMLNTPQGPQTFPGGDPNPFSAAQRGRLPVPPGPPFRPTAPGNFPGGARPPLNVSSPMQLRAPPPAGLYHTSHPLDPSPSGGGAINIPVTNPGISKPSPPPNFRGPAPGQIPPMLPRFPGSPGLRPPHGSPPRNENFPGYPPNFYGNFPPPPPSSGDPLLPHPPYPDQFDDGHVPDGVNPKPFDDETGGEFGGLASYFASQREDDLDT